MGGYEYAQAMMTLDKRWLDGGIAANLGEEAGSLYLSVWSKQLSVEAYDGHYNLAVSRAARIGQTPLDDSVEFVQYSSEGGGGTCLLPPPLDSVFYPAAEEARVVTRGGESSTIADRVAFRMAMLEAVSKQASAAEEQVACMSGCVVHTQASTLKVMRCMMCPLRPDGTHTLHLGDVRCVARRWCSARSATLRGMRPTRATSHMVFLKMLSLRLCTWWR